MTANNHHIVEIYHGMTENHYYKFEIYPDMTQNHQDKADIYRGLTQRFMCHCPVKSRIYLDMTVFLELYRCLRINGYINDD